MINCQHFLPYLSKTPRISIEYVMDVRDFSKAKYTAILSDIHLCEEEPVNLRYPLWKKYKTREFFIDEEFKSFLGMLHKKTRGEPIELVLNGDIFDFDSVTSFPEMPPYQVTWLERHRGLHPQAEKSEFKIRKILNDHPVWTEALRWFLRQGHRAIFVIGNHDLELHFLNVQQAICDILNLPEELKDNVRFTEWFYISNKDTLIEHGNQYDPYCMAQDPVNPYILSFNRIEVRVPFGNLATRYLVNGMGFFNPHIDTNYLMSAGEYVKFFFRYIIKAQPLLMITWIWSATVILFQSFIDRLRPPMKDPLTAEDKVEFIAKKANASPRMVRELKDLFVAPVNSNPLLMLQELWLDRAFLVVLMFFLILQLFVFIKAVYEISFFWMFIPLFVFLPFFIFYSKSISSSVVEFKEPREKILNLASMIAKVHRVIYGHTHLARHEIIGAVEHLNSGTWSPAFEDLECTKPIGEKTFVWIEPSAEDENIREATLKVFEKGEEKPLSSSKLLGGYTHPA